MILEIALTLTLQDIGWLAGEWQLTSGSRCVEAVDRASSNMLVGMSRTVAGARPASSSCASSRVPTISTPWRSLAGGRRSTSSSSPRRRPSCASRGGAET